MLLHCNVVTSIELACILLLLIKCDFRRLWCTNLHIGGLLNSTLTSESTASSSNTFNKKQT